MIKNMIFISLRLLERNLGYSVINIFGLAIGLACFLLMILWVQHELSYDRFHSKSENIYRVIPVRETDDVVYGGGVPPLASDLVEAYPEVKEATRFLPISTASFRVNNKIINEKNGIMVDKNFLKFFSFDYKYGSFDFNDLDPNMIVLTKKLAEKYFGNISPVGKAIILDNRDEYIVSAVINDVPVNSHLQFEFIISLEQYLIKNKLVDDWGAWFIQTYILLEPNVAFNTIRNKISNFLKSKNKNTTANLKLIIQPLLDIHLYSGFYDRDGDGDYRLVQLLSIIAWLVLLIACINFINLTTARSTKRAKEVGVRKVIGSSRKQLIKQFFGESFLYTIISSIFALIIIETLSSTISRITGVDLTYNLLDFKYLLIIFSSIIFTAVLSGSYPALFLSKFNPTEVLKIKSTGSRRGSVLRKLLVVGQFSFTIVLLIIGLIISTQIDFIKNRSLGYDKDNTIVINRQGNLLDNYKVIKQEIELDPNITGVTSVRQIPTKFTLQTPAIDWKGKGEESVSMTISLVEENFIDVMGINLIEGRNFSEFSRTDSSNFIINETTARLISDASPLGMKIKMWGKEGEIMGIVKDFHFKSLNNKIQPLLFMLNDFKGSLLAKIKPGKTVEAINFLETFLKDKNSDYPFEYYFLEDEYQKYFESDNSLAKVINIFMILSLIISSLGMLGLAAFTAESRIKEIGIRKILGASTLSLSFLLSWQFIRLILLAASIAIPVSYYLGNIWLMEYAYRTELSFQIFVAGVGGAIIMGLIIVGFQTTKASFSNPVNSIKHE